MAEQIKRKFKLIALEDGDAVATMEVVKGREQIVINKVDPELISVEQAHEMHNALQKAMPGTILVTVPNTTTLELLEIVE